MIVTRGVSWLSLALIAGLMGCVGTSNLGNPPVIAPGLEGNSDETLAALVRRHKAYQRLSPSRLAGSIDRVKVRFSEAPNLQTYRQLTSLMALRNVPFAEKLAILELLQQRGRAFASSSNQDLHLVSEKAVFDIVQQQKHIRELTAAVMDRDRKVTALEHTVNGLAETGKRCHANVASLEHQLHSLQSRALKLRRQLDELGRIEESIEDRRQSTPLELPKQDD